MESFAAVVRTLLRRIRAIQDSQPPVQWPPSASAPAALGPIYRVRPTLWGVEEPGCSKDESSTRAARDATPTPTASGPRRRLRLAVYSLPVPKGLPAT